jgi:hypothetical protein
MVATSTLRSRKQRGATDLILSWLTANATYRYGFQETSGSGSIPRSIFSLSLGASYPSASARLAGSTTSRRNEGLQDFSAFA